MNKFMLAAFAVAALGITSIASAPASAAIAVDPLTATQSAASSNGKSDLIQVARRGGGLSFHGRGHRGFRGGGHRGF